MSKTARLIAFLASAFVSAVGDNLLGLAVPAGLGLETGDIRSAVLMWLIPAVAMFSSSFLNRRIEGRHRTVRTDYGKLLLGIAVLEIAIAVLALVFRTPHQTVVLITAFVFAYAVAKEGIPRLLYLVSVYRFFVDDKDYSRAAGLHSALNIAASLLGAIFAAAIIYGGSWRTALLVDAVTFLVFGAAVLFFGRDPSIESPESNVSGKSALNEKIAPADEQPSLRKIAAFVPLIFGVNALVWNYLPLLTEKFSILTAVNSILVMGFIRMPGLVSGLFFDRISRVLSKERIVFFVPPLFIGASLVFSAVPSNVTFIFLVFMQGILSGLYWPADFSLRNALPHSRLISFNAMVLRRLALFQFAACLMALFVFAPDSDRTGYVPLFVAALAGVSVLSSIQVGRVATRVAASALVLGTAIFGVGCERSSVKQVKRAILPSISRNLELRTDLTFAAMVILNETSAHFLTVSSDLTIQGQVLKRFESIDSGRKYALEINSDYRTARGESVTAQDVAFSIRVYLSKYRDLSGGLKSIAGADGCRTTDCTLPGIAVDGPTRLVVRLARPDLRFVENLASPWFILFKEGRPLLETVGMCTVPYQTGRAVITKCDDSGVQLKIKDQELLLADHAAKAEWDAPQSLDRFYLRKCRV